MWDGLVVPELLRDEDNARQPHGSPVILERLATLAAAPEYRSDVLMVSDANENAHAPCWGFPLDETGGTAGVEGEAEPDEAARRPDLQARVTLEYVLAIVLRTTTSMQIKSFLLMIVGVLALHSNLSTEMWEVFRMLGALFSKPVVEAFCDLVDEKLRVDPVSTNANTRLVVKDNCAYRVNTKFVHADAAGETLQTVNWLSVPIPGDLFPTNIKRGEWQQAGKDRFHTRNRFNPDNPAIEAFVVQTWRAMMSAAADVDITSRPSTDAKPERSVFVYEQPVVGAGTAKTQDIDTVNCHIKHMFVHKAVSAISGRTVRDGQGINAEQQQANVVLSVDDQQTYSRDVSCKLNQPDLNDWLVPLPCDFHFTANLLMALHILNSALVMCVVDEFDQMGGGGQKRFSKTIGPAWDGVEVYDHYDEFYQLLIGRMAAHFAKVVPREVLFNPTVLEAAVGGNKRVTFALSFLMRFGLPWLSLRHAVRVNLHQTIDTMYEYGFHWFLATGKTNYIDMCILVVFVRHAMVASLALIHNRMRTASLWGHAARNVAWGFVNERFNLETKAYVGDSPSREQLLSAYKKLNVFRHVLPRLRQLMGLASREPPEYSHHLPADVARMDAVMCKVFGGTWEEMCAQDATFFQQAADIATPHAFMRQVSLEGARPRGPIDTSADNGTGPTLDDTQTDVYEVEEVLAERGKKGVNKEFKVRFRGYPNEAPSWIPDVDMNAEELVEALRANKRVRANTKKAESASGPRGRVVEDPMGDMHPDREVPWFQRVTMVLKTKAFDK
jgi:hypothetical protein